MYGSHGKAGSKASAAGGVCSKRHPPGSLTHIYPYKLVGCGDALDIKHGQILDDPDRKNAE